MFTTTSTRPASSRRKFLNHSANRRATFAREATLDAFGRQAVHHLDEPAFERGAADEMIDGRQAVVRWLALADSLEGKEAAIARQTADELCRVLGLSLVDVLERAAA